MTDPDPPHVDVPPEDEEGVEEIDVPEVPEPERPDEAVIDGADDYREGVDE